MIEKWREGSFPLRLSGWQWLMAVFLSLSAEEPDNTAQFTFGWVWIRLNLPAVNTFDQLPPIFGKKATDPKHKRQQETAWLNVMTAIPVFGRRLRWITLDSFANCVSFHNTDAHGRAQRTRGSRLLNNHHNGSRDLITVKCHVGHYSCHHENKVIIQIEMRKVWIVFRFRTTLSKNTRGWY